MKHKTTHTLYAYWNEIRGQRVAPSRFEIEPSRIAAILPDTFILDCGEPRSYRFRLAGTRMSSLLGRDIRDTGFLDLFHSSDHGTLSHVLQHAIDLAPASLLTTVPSAAATTEAAPDPTMHIEILLLPLFHTTNAVTRMVGCAVPLEPLIVGRSAFTGLQTLAHHDTIWPDGRPHAVLETMHRQAPFAPEHRGGRIVASDRRRFRVFDGGKSA